MPYEALLTLAGALAAAAQGTEGLPPPNSAELLIPHPAPDAASEIVSPGAAAPTISPPSLPSDTLRDGLPEPQSQPALKSLRGANGKIAEGRGVETSVADPPLLNVNSSQQESDSTGSAGPLTQEAAAMLASSTRVRVSAGSGAHPSAAQGQHEENLLPEAKPSAAGQPFRLKTPHREAPRKAGVEILWEAGAQTTTSPFEASGMMASRAPTPAGHDHDPQHGSQPPSEDTADLPEEQPEAELSASAQAEPRADAGGFKDAVPLERTKPSRNVVGVPAPVADDNCAFEDAVPLESLRPRQKDPPSISQPVVAPPLPHHDEPFSTSVGLESPAPATQ